MTTPLGKNFLLKYESPTTPGTYLTLANMRTNSMSLNNESIDVTDKDGMPWRKLIEGGIRSMDLQADGVIGENEHLRGILYNFITKSPPDERPRNADGLYCNKPTKKNYVEALAGMYDGQWAEHGDPMELPIEMTEKGLNSTWYLRSTRPSSISTSPE